MKKKLRYIALLLMLVGVVLPGSVLAKSPPVADPNGPYTGDEGSAIGLDGTGSTDPDGDPLSLMAATAGAILAQPLGLFLQEQYTTSGQPGNLEIKNIQVKPTANLIIHRVETIQ